VQADRKFIKRATAKIAAHRHRNLHSDALDFLLAQFRPKLFPKKINATNRRGKCQQRNSKYDITTETFKAECFHFTKNLYFSM